MSDALRPQVPYEPGLTTYRAYILNPDGSIGSVAIIDARSDDEAIGKARGMVNGHGIDLWERLRFLGSYPPRKASANGSSTA